MVEISGSFTDKNGWAGGIRRNQAIAAFADPDARVDLALDPTTALVLVTKRSERPRPHVILLIASESGKQPMAVASGYRLYGSEDELVRIAADPKFALNEVIRRFGLAFSLGGRERVKYLEQTHVDSDEFEIEGAAGSGDVTSSFFMRRSPDGGFDVSYAWAIDEARYRTALSAN